MDDNELTLRDDVVTYIESRTNEPMPSVSDPDAWDTYIERHAQEVPDLRGLMASAVVHPDDALEESKKKEAKTEKKGERFKWLKVKRWGKLDWSRPKLRLGAFFGLISLLGIIFLLLSLTGGGTSEVPLPNAEAEVIPEQAQTGGQVEEDPSGMAELEAAAREELNSNTPSTGQITVPGYTGQGGTTGGGFAEDTEGGETYTPPPANALASRSQMPPPPRAGLQRTGSTGLARIQRSGGALNTGIQRSGSGQSAGIQRPQSLSGDRVANYSRGTQELSPEPQAQEGRAALVQAFGRDSSTQRNPPSQTQPTEQGAGLETGRGGVSGGSGPLAGMYKRGDVVEASLIFGIITTDDEGASDEATNEVLARGEDGSLWVGKPVLQRTNRMEIFFRQVILDGSVEEVTALSLGLDGFAGLPAQVKETTPALAADISRGIARGVADHVNDLGQQQTLSFRGNTPIVTNDVVPVAESIAGSVGRLFEPDEREQRALLRVAQVEEGKKMKIIVIQ